MFNKNQEQSLLAAEHAYCHQILIFVERLVKANMEYVLGLHYVKTLWLQLVWINEQNIAPSERDSRVTTWCLHPSCPVNYLHVSGAFSYIPRDNWH